jgi:pantothenate synthetase
MEYITFADAETLALRESVVPGTLLAVAARVGRTRLIDNVLLM